VASLRDVAKVVSGLPEVAEGERHGNRTWFVRDKAFAWERPFSRADLLRFGDAPVPEGPILAVRTADLEDKEALLAAAHEGFFTIEHFDGFAAVLIALRKTSVRPLRQAVEDAWLACAPAAVARAYLEGSTPGARRRRR
jgi:hypothetical protein